MTKIEDSTISLIKKTAEKLADYYVCPGYDRDDIIQEAIMYGISKLKDYDEDRATNEKGLENFMYVVMMSRLTNLKKQKWYDFKRDHGGVNTDKKKIKQPLRLNGEAYYIQAEFDQIDDAEILDLVMEYMPTKYRLDYEKILEGVSVQSVRREKILAAANEIYSLIMDNKVHVLKKRKRQEELDGNENR